MVELLTHTDNPTERLKEYYGQCYQKAINIKTLEKLLHHESVLEHISYTFKIKCSRIAHLQFVRHRIASYTSQSHRYTEINLDDLSYFIPRRVKELGLEDEWKKDCGSIYTMYQKWIYLGLLKQDARYLVNDGCAITFVTTMNLRTLINFFALRTDEHAQEEIRVIAMEMLALVLETVPELKETLENIITHHLN